MRLSVVTTAPSVKETSNATKENDTFLSGVAVLTASTVLVKLIGLFYKIPMLHYLGSEGMGYFNAAYEWYATLCVIASAGLPLASSMLIAQARARCDGGMLRRVERITLRLFLLLGFAGATLLFFCAGAIAAFIGSPQTKYALMAVSPTVLFSCLSGAYRGYFQGYQNMRPTAVSQIIEAAGKLLLGLGCAVLAWRNGLDAHLIAAWAMLGLSIGVAISTLYLIVTRRIFAPKEQWAAPSACEVRPSRSALSQLLSIAIPITLSSSVLSLTRILDTTLILRRLQFIGYDVSDANALYGNYTTMVVPIFNLIPSLVTSVSLALIPTLKKAIESGRVVEQTWATHASIRMTALLSIPASLALCIYSKTVLRLLFGSQSAAVEIAAPMLSILSVSILFSGLITTSNAILQAYGYVNAPIFSMLTGAVVKLICAYVLIGCPSINIYGAPIGSFVCDATIVGINLTLIAKRTPVLSRLWDLLTRPLVVSVVSVGLPGMVYAVFIRNGYAGIPLFLVAVPVTLLLFAALCIRFGLIGEQELSSIPIVRRWIGKYTNKKAGG